MYLDFDCDCVNVGDKRRIVKATASSAPHDRRSTANAFFENTFIPKLYEDCANYYRTWVDTKAMNMSSADEIKQMIHFIDQEEDRAKFYIHDPKSN